MQNEGNMLNLDFPPEMTNLSGMKSDILNLHRTLSSTNAEHLAFEKINDEFKEEMIFATVIIWVLSISLVIVSALATFIILKQRKSPKYKFTSSLDVESFPLFAEKSAESYEYLYQNSIYKQRELFYPETKTTFQGTHQPFVNQFSGRVGYQGGEISSPKSGVKVVVPKGAIPHERGEQIIYVNVALNGTQFNLSPGNKQIQVCPVVECLAPGLDFFRIPVTVKIPHRADVIANDWKFKAKYTNDPLGGDTVWKDIPLSCNYDEDFVYIKTNHFTSFSCFGFGGNRLKLTGVVYGNVYHNRNNQQLNFRVYVCSGYQDVLQHLEQLEERLGSSTLRSQPKPLIIRNNKNLEIRLKSKDEEDWPWKLKNNQTEAVQEILLEHCHSCCDTPPSVDFRCVPKDDQSLYGTYLETVFEISQISKDRSMMKHVQLVAQDFSPVFTEGGSSQPSFSNQVPPEVLNTVVSDLIVARGEVLTLFRILGLDEANIQTIANNCHNNLKEQIYAMISKWESSRPVGTRATVQEFIQGCEKCNLNAIADKLRDFISA